MEQFDKINSDRLRDRPEMRCCAAAIIPMRASTNKARCPCGRAGSGDTDTLSPA